LGSVLGCFIVCSSGGACDTTYIFIDIALPAPVAQNDSLEIGFNQATGTVDVCLNDSGQSTTVSIVRQPTLGVLTLNGCSVTYTVNEGLCGVDSFQYAISNSGGSDIATVYVNTACSPFIIYEGFSPNGDGENDALSFQYLEFFGPAQLTVFNRWGIVVYSNSDYQNDWVPTVSDGTYFYELILADGKAKTSTLLVVRP
jgi:gliding motility-associated-like protein